MSLLNSDLYSDADPIHQLPVIEGGVWAGIGGCLVTQAQFDVVTSFCFNITPPQFLGSSFVTELNAGNYNQAVIELIRWQLLLGSVNQQMVNRRTDEGSKFMGLNPFLG
jgi:hypothetical protein